MVKAFMCLLLFASANYMAFIYSGGVQPEVAMDLALEQLRNPSIVTDTAQRAFNNWQIPVMNLLACVFSLLLFRKEITICLKEMSK